MRKKLLISTSSFIVFSSLLVGVLGFVDPSDRDVVVIILPVLLTWFVLISGFRIFLLVIRKDTNRFLKIITYAFSALLILLLLLEGIGQLTLLDALLAIMLVVLVSFYFSRTWSK